MNLGTRKIITYQPDGFFSPLAALNFFNVATAMLKKFALLKEKITSSFLVHYLLPRPLYKPIHHLQFEPLQTQHSI